MNLVYFVGKHLEGEGKDLSDISLPGHQLDMMQDAEAASKNGKIIQNASRMLV